ncbi:hypothetical protein IWW49_001244, partial [Coemansia sp. RSA 1797]
LLYQPSYQPVVLPMVLPLMLSQLVPILSQHMSMPSQLPPMPSQLPLMQSQHISMLSQHHMAITLAFAATALAFAATASAVAATAAAQAWHVLQEWLSTEQLPPQQPPVQQVQPLVQNTKKRRLAQLRQKADCQYIDELSQAQLQSTAGRCAGGSWLAGFAVCHARGQLHRKKHLYRYTRNQQCKETRVTRFKRILEKVKPVDVAEAERSLGAGSCIKPDLVLFKEYLVARAQVADKLTRFYNETYTVHPTSTHPIHKDKLKAEVRAYPLHRKLRLSAYVNQKQADQRLIKKLRKEFGPNAVIIIGDWSAPMNRFHEPIRGKGWWTLLKRGGFEVYLIKEYLTSKTCPNCYGQLSNTRYVPNPRPFRCTKRPKVKCHGLLGCQSEKCLESIDKIEDEKECESEGEKKEKVQRWWNRDLAAVLNFRHILFSLRETGFAPTRFQRKQPTEARKTTARKPRKTPKASMAPNPTNNFPVQL